MPARGKLSEADIASSRRVKTGAKACSIRAVGDSRDSPLAEDYWAFKRPSRQSPGGRPRYVMARSNPLEVILAKLEAKE